MKLRFKKGAVVSLELIGTGEPIIKSGKVEDVLEDEVVLIEQVKIESEEDTFVPLCYDLSRSVDGKMLHINRALIAGWEYASWYTATVAYHRKLDLSKATFTYYDKEGYCYGDGVDFSDIPDCVSSHFVIGASKDNSNGLELSR